MRPYPAAVTCLTRPIGRIDLPLDILRIIRSGGILLSLDDFDIVAEERVIVCFSLHRRLYSFFRCPTALLHTEFAVGCWMGASKCQFADWSWRQAADLP